MLLCVDVGNTEIALGLYAEGDEDEARPPLVRDWRMHTEPRMTADELEVAVGEMLGRRYAEQITGVAALSTVPSLLRELKLLVERRAEPSVVVGPGVRTGVPLLVDNPREVGADRVVSTLAAHRLYDTACVVVDFGTSTNIDVVSAKGEFLGARSRPASRSPWRRSPPGRPRCARSNWWRPARSSARTRWSACRRACSTASPGRSTGWCAASSTSWAPARSP
jgi:type III pantothenate kinase